MTDEEIISDVMEKLKGYSPAIAGPILDEFIDPATQITFSVTMSREWLDVIPGSPELLAEFQREDRRER